MIKKTLIIFASIILAAYLYSIYCDHFWRNYNKVHFVYGESDETDELTDFSFKPFPEIPSDTILTKENFRKYTWHRELIEPWHGQWINDVELSFPGDSVVFYRVTAQYFSDNYWTYPLLKKFRSKVENTYTHQFYFDKSSMNFVTQKNDTVNIVLGKRNLIINYVFL